MKVEYLYMDFDDDRSGNLDGDVFQHENDIHTLKVGLNYSLQRDFEPLR
jgi:opacity protein-like surface antigen